MTDTSFLRHFESLGDNCEFGFVLVHNGINDGGMFRWTMIRDFRYMVAALNDGLAGIYELQNLTPVTKDMVRDARHGLEFHTKMPIERHESGFRYATPSEGRASIYATEKQKFDYLVDKFLRVVRTASKIFVLKSIEPIERELVDEVLESVRKFGDVSMLWVCEADASHEAGRVDLLSDNLYQGFIPKFSVNVGMDDIDMSAWATVCERALRLHTSIHGAMKDSEDSPRHPEQRPTSLPEWFDAQAYLIANPDVEAAGMDAGEHYLHFGWNERRPLRL